MSNLSISVRGTEHESVAKSGDYSLTSVKRRSVSLYTCERFQRDENVLKEEPWTN